MGLNRIFGGRYALVMVLGCLATGSLAGQAQELDRAPNAPEISRTGRASLPDAPLPVASSSSSADVETAAAGAAPEPAVTTSVLPGRKQASKYRLIVRSDEVVPQLTAADKLTASLVDRATLGAFGATLFTAGWSHLQDSEPHYGSDKAAFGERLGALSLDEATQSFFSHGVYASLAHTDPRYYVMGRREPITRRIVYSATRLVVTKSDDGHDRINWPKLAGIATATALTNLYYPKRDTGVVDSLSSFGVSCGTSVLTLELHEFLGDALRAVRGVY